MKRVILLTITLLLALPHPSRGAIPPKMSYQGLLTNGSGVPLGGSQDFIFRIYETATGGTALWEETQSGVMIKGGVFNVVLGAVNPINLRFDGPYWLGVTVPAGSGEELTPRTPLLTSPYAFRAANADTALVSLSAGPADTLWHTDGTNIYRLTGNVGIGRVGDCIAFPPVFGSEVSPR